MSPWRILFRKELQETLRDRRTVLVIFLLPLVLYPLLAFGMAEWLGSYLGQQQKKPTRVTLRGADEDTQQLRQLLVGQKDIVLVDGRPDVWLDARTGFRKKLLGLETAVVELRATGVDEWSEIALARVRKLLENTGAEFRGARLQKAGVSDALVEPLRIEEKSTRNPTRLAAHHVGRALPLFILMFAAAAALYPAIDLTAGEKERGTLETLLAAPITARDLVVGKYLTVCVLSLVGAILNLSAIGLTISKFLPASAETSNGWDVPWFRLVAVLPSAALTAFFVSAVVMTVACLARTAKDAQLFAVPVHLAILVPGFAAQLPGMELNWATGLVPCVNLALLIKASVGGGGTGVGIVLTVLSTGFYVVLALAFAERLFSGEALLFSGDSGRRRPTLDRLVAADLAPHASPGEALGVVAIAFVLLIYVGQRWQAENLISGILRTELLLVLLPCWVLLRWRRLSKSALGFLRASGQAYVGAALCGLSAWALAAALVDSIQQRVLPMPPEFLEMMRRLLFPDPPRPFGLEFLAFALVPAVCEETLFRGLLLRATLPLLGRWRAVVLNALVFGAFHLSIYRFAPTAALGLLLAVIAIRTGSVLPGILFHVLNNGLALLMGRLAGPEVALGDASPPPQVFVVAFVTAVAGLWLAGRPKRPRGGTTLLNPDNS